MTGVLETTVYCEPSERAEVERFYADALGLAQVARWATGTAFRVGPGVVLLFDREALAASDDPVAAHGTTGPGHVCLRAAEGEYEDWRARLERAGVTIAHETTWGGGLRSFYFVDPAGNLLEVAEGDLWPPAA